MEAGASKKEPKLSDAKAGEEDLSMEEILQSIRRIIADDDNEGKKPVSSETNGKGKSSTDEVPGSDMLELTEMLKDDGTVVDLKKGSSSADADDDSPISFDILSQIDKVLEADRASEAVKAAPAAAMPMSAPMSAPAAIASTNVDSLLSETAAAATAEAFNRLKSMDTPTVYAQPSSSPAFRSGSTIEDLVSDMLKPMLKQWLDANLPSMVQQIVEREVKKLTR
jgi:cell pole-organizing protein PopZ